MQGQTGFLDESLCATPVLHGSKCICNSPFICFRVLQFSFSLILQEIHRLSKLFIWRKTSTTFWLLHLILIYYCKRLIFFVYMFVICLEDEESKVER